jgi:SAM-dependent methyltransferase
MNEDFANSLVQKTIDDYNRIAPLWSRKRWKVPSDILALKRYLHDGDTILDLGCGIGFLYEIIDPARHHYIGIDASKGQIEEAKKRYPKADFRLTKPFSFEFAGDSFDAVFCLSTIHHIPANFRNRFLQEIKRILKQNGTLIISAWNVDESRIKERLSDPQLDKGDFFIPFKDELGETKANRYIHSFSEAEFQALLSANGLDIVNISIEKRGIGKNQNILVVAKK